MQILSSKNHLDICCCSVPKLMAAMVFLMADKQHMKQKNSRKIGSKTQLFLKQKL